MRDDGLPGFLVIGAMRAGTTALWRMLAQHPELRMSEPKEPYFFVHDNTGIGCWEQGLDWYKSIFPQEPGLRGEASTLYTRFPYHPGVVDRIHQVIPNVKLIYLVREPVERAISQYFHSTLKGLEHRPIMQALCPSASSSYVLTGLYYLQISLYLTQFRRDQLCIISSEELWRHPRKTMKTLFQFLGVEEIDVKMSGARGRNSFDDLVGKFRAGLRKVEHPAQVELLKLLEEHSGERLESNEIARQLGFATEQRASFARCFHEDSAKLKQLAGSPLWSRSSSSDSR